MPPIAVEIPDDIPEKLEFIDKQGNVVVQNAREVYECAFRAGWKQYWDLYVKGEVDIKNPAPDVPLVQEYILETKARTSGFYGCRDALQKILNDSDQNK